MAYTAPLVAASGTAFAAFQSGGLSGQIEALITAQVALLSPTVKAAWTATGGGSTGGFLPAGTYYATVTESSGLTETSGAPESDQITVSAGNIPRLTFQSLKTGNVTRNVYIGAKNGLTGGPYTLYASGIAASTYDFATAPPTGPTAVNPPAASRITPEAMSLIRAGERGNLQDNYRALRQLVDEFNRGEPVVYVSLINRVRRLHGSFLLLATACSEMAVLIEANQGTLAATGIGARPLKRTWS